MKKLMVGFVLVGVLLGAAGCGGSDEPAASAGPALSKDEFSGKVQAALQGKKTFHLETVTTDSDGPGTFVTDVRLDGKGADVSGSAMGTSVVRIGGTLYGKGAQLSNNPAKPWVKHDPAAKGAGKDTSALMAGAMLQLLSPQLDQYLVVAGAPYATEFSSAPGDTIDGAATTKYKMTVDVVKATGAKAFGTYLTPETAGQSQLTTLPIEISVDADALPRSFSYEAEGAKIEGKFSKFGDPLTITAPAADQIA
ncbi:hypothetical protein [Kribbella sp. NPDC051770]|uniref:hypothetical protein n=1 Tax=Kribbella sp. NPDC051770 TaxID=3155413 RepID=UPI00342E6D54